MKTLILKKYTHLLWIFSNFLALEARHPAIIKEEFIFKRPPFASCHASTLTQTASGAILCSYFAGSEEGANDVAIWLSASSENKWSEPQKIAEAESVPCWNPVLFTLPSKEILLFYKAGKNPQMWSGLLKRSSDEGASWSEPRDLPAGIIGPAKNRPLLLPDGTLLCGSSAESWRRWGCFIDATTDQCDSWNKSAPINLPDQLFGIIQPTLFWGKERSLKLLARSHQVGFICTAESHDLGKTWSPAKPTALPNPNSSVDAINLSDGRIALVYNHSATQRYPLNLALSEDGGDSWKTVLTLEKKPGEYSYPCILQAADGKLHISYTHNRKQIKYLVIDPSRL